jgi:beta-glucosidase
MASSWNPELVWEIGKQIRHECMATGVSQVLGPDLDLARELRWGRVEETYGEDPYLASLMGVAMIKGLQEGDKTDGKILIANAKPFLTYCSPLGGLNLASTPGGWYDLYNTYLPPFKAAIQEGEVLSVMTAYNSYDGVALNANKEIYTDLLRTKLGFKGYVYSDWGAVRMLHTFHKVAENKAVAGKMAIEAGVDLEAPAPECFRHLDSLVRNNIVSMNTIDQATERILYVKFKSGLFEFSPVDTSIISDNMHLPESVALSKKMADESIVLLKNENNLLPLDISTLKSIAVIGPNADQVQFGDYTWSRNNKDGITVLEGLKAFAAGKLSINYAKGCDLISLDDSGLDDAIRVAEKSDLAIVVIGTASAALARDYSNCTSGEGFDLSDLNPTGLQEELVRGVYATGKPTIVVLVQGKPFSIPWMKDNIPAIVEAWYPGERGGESIVEVLFGIVNPSGKLPVSFPQSVGHLPCYYNHLPTDKGLYKKPGEYGNPGRDYVFSIPNSLWSFGYGLSYTTFSYESVNLSSENVNLNDSLTITAKIKNTGSREGMEVVQLYIRKEYSSVVRPVKELKAFKKVSVQPGEVKQVEMTLKISECGYYNNLGEYILEPGIINIMIGSSSEDIHLTAKVNLEAI